MHQDKSIEELQTRWDKARLQIIERIIAKAKKRSLEEQAEAFTDDRKKEET